MLRITGRATLGRIILTTLVDRLVDAGARLEAREEFGNTPLILAARYGGSDVVRSLIAVGAAVNATNNDRVSAMHMAAQSGDTAVVEALIEAGADLNAIAFGQTPLHVAVASKNPSVAQMLRQHGAE